MPRRSGGLQLPATDQNSPRIWVELDDLIRHFDHSPTPTGIGRVQFEILPQLLAAAPDRVSFCRIGSTADDVQVIPPEQLATLLDGGRTLAALAGKPAAGRIVANLEREMTRAGRRLRHSLFEAEPARRAFRDGVRPGDVILALGGSWTHRRFGPTLRTLKQRHGLRFVLLVHDIVPISHPHFVSRSYRPKFVKWLEQMRRSWDIVLTPSRASADDLARYLTAIGAPLPPLHPIPFGFGFTAEKEEGPVEAVEAGPYALFVSTIDIRKNHILLLRIWERLIAAHGRAGVPKLLLAGGRGWGAEPFWRAMHASHGLDGHIRVVSDLSDGQMARAYDDSLFTVFPSLCEGWGLPVSESLYHGKLCVASNATSLPEVGGAAVDYFDPRDEEAAYAAIERVIVDPAYRASRERWIAEHFTLPVWRDTAQAILDIVAPARAAVRA